ncbi:MAG: hypothetical protein ABJA87_11800 [bacterium]
MDVLLLGLGAVDLGRASAALAAAGGRVEAQSLPARPERVELNAVLERRDERRLVITADTASLAVVLRRLLRRGELATAETAVLPTVDVPFLAGHGVPTDLARAAVVALAAPCRTVGVLKDDSGDVVVDSAGLRPETGRRAWVRAYVDDERLADGPVSWLRVQRPAGGGLRATVAAGRFARPRTVEGRALQLACDPCRLSSDGRDREQPRRRRTWWDEPDQWRLAVGNAR